MAFAILPTNIFLNTNNNNNDDDDQECIVRIFCWTWIRPHTPEDDYDDGDDVIIFSTNSVDWSSTRASGWHKIPLHQFPLVFMELLRRPPVNQVVCVSQEQTSCVTTLAMR